MKLSDFNHSNHSKALESVLGKAVIKFVEFIDTKSLLVVFQDSKNFLGYVILDTVNNLITNTYMETTSNFNINNMFISKVNCF